MHWVPLLTLALCACACAEKWRWPEAAQSVRLDSKVRFLDNDYDRRDDKSSRSAQLDELQFRPASDTSGFYNQPPGRGRYPVHVQSYRPAYQVDPQAVYNLKKTHSPAYGSDGTLDSLKFCKCVSEPDCQPAADSARACGSGKYLCCYKRPNKNPLQNSEYFNEVDDERPALLPGNSGGVGPFPPPPGLVLNGNYGPQHHQESAVLGLQGSGPDNTPILVGPGGPTGVIGPINKGILVGPGGLTGQSNKGILVGPGGPTGQVGPPSKGVLGGTGRPSGIVDQSNNGVLVGPGGPTGIVGPANKGVLVGPGGPTGIIGPHNKNIPFGEDKRPVLVGPEGPTGVIGPIRNQKGYITPAGVNNHYGPNDADYYDSPTDETAQRGVLVGPGGPTGIIGPATYGRRPVLVGPGGPTGIIGPYGRSYRAPVLVGPGGPTGIIGPHRRPYYYGK